MIRHYELTKIGEIFEGKMRAEQLEELVGLYEGMLANVEGIASHQIYSTSDCMDPLVADLMVIIDFESAEAMKEYDLDMDRIALQFKMAEQAESMLTYDVEL